MSHLWLAPHQLHASFLSTCRPAVLPHLRLLPRCFKLLRCRPTSACSRQQLPVRTAQVAPHHDCFIHAQLVASTPAGLIVEAFTDPERDPLQAELFEARRVEERW